MRCIVGFTPAEGEPISFCSSKAEPSPDKRETTEHYRAERPAWPNFVREQRTVQGNGGNDADGGAGFRPQIFEFETVRGEFRSSQNSSRTMPAQSRFESARWPKPTPWLGNREKSHHGPGQWGLRYEAQPEGSFEKMHPHFPVAEGRSSAPGL
jgi:hypothetical protein